MDLGCSSTQKRCNHLVIDAGRVLVKSALADKEAIREIEKKRNKQYTEDDYKQLESLMYDNYSVQLIAAQVCNLVIIFSKLYF